MNELEYGPPLLVMEGESGSALSRDGKMVVRFGTWRLHTHWEHHRFWLSTTLHPTDVVKMGQIGIWEGLELSLCRGSDTFHALSEQAGTRFTDLNAGEVLVTVCCLGSPKQHLRNTPFCGANQRIDRLEERTRVTEIHSRRDVEVSRGAEHVVLTPVSDKGVHVLSDYLGSKVQLHAPVQVTPTQERALMPYVRDQQHYGEFSMGAKRYFRGQRLSPASDDFSSSPSREALARYTFGSHYTYVPSHDFTVISVRYGPPAADQLYKITKTSDTPHTSSALSIGTLEYYRATVDRDEGTFASSPSEGIALRTLDDELIADSATIQSLRLSINPCWIYCTTTIASEQMSPSQSAWYKDSESATRIVSPINHFARKLGASFGAWSKPRFKDVYESIDSVETLRQTNNAIIIIHGAVRYMDVNERHRYLQKLHREDRQLWRDESVFTKTSEFAPEKEYRFGIWGWGPPLQNHILLPLTSQLLACFGPSVPAAKLRV